MVNEKKRTLFTGKVVSDKMDKTVTVEIERKLAHPTFGKVIRLRRKFAVHDEHEQASVGDIVTFEECKPISKRKYMRLAQILKQNNVNKQV